MMEAMRRGGAVKDEGENVEESDELLVTMVVVSPSLLSPTGVLVLRSGVAAAAAI